MGLYLMEEARKGTWIARYNGDPLTKKECDKRRRSQYKIQVHKNLFLDAENPCHFEGRFINDAKDSSAFKTNARFASNYAAMPPTHAQPLATPGCVSTQRGRSMQMKKFYWLWKRFLGQPRATNKDDTTIPDDYNHRFECNTTIIIDIGLGSAHIHPGRCHPKHRHTKEVHVSSMIWTEQPPAPSSPVMLGHANNKSNQRQDYGQPPQHIIHFHSNISPIISTHSHNITHSMNEKYSSR